MHSMNGYMGGMAWYWIIGLIGLILVVWLIVWAIRQNAGDMKRPESTPMNILKDRYARGEIAKEEFEEKKRTLNS